MKTRLHALLRALALATAILTGEPAGAALAPDQLTDVGVRPPPGATLPLDARLTSLDGRPMTLGAAIGGRPSVVIFADYDCPQLCSPILALAADALAKSGLTPGADFQLVRLALVEAGKGTIGAIADQVRLRCYGFSASIGFYTNRVRILLAAGGIATVLAIVVGFIALLRQTPVRRA